MNCTNISMFSFNLKIKQESNVLFEAHGDHKTFFSCNSNYYFNLFKIIIKIYNSILILNLNLIIGDLLLSLTVNNICYKCRTNTLIVYVV